MTSEKVIRNLRIASAYALCRKAGHDPEANVDGMPLWKSYLPHVDKELDEHPTQHTTLPGSEKD